MAIFSYDLPWPFLCACLSSNILFSKDTNVTHLFSLVNCSNLLPIFFYQVFFLIWVCFPALLKCNWCIANCTVGLPRWLSGKESDCPCRIHKRPRDSFPGLGRSSGEGHGHPLQYSCLENPMHRGAWRAIVHEVTKSQTRLKQLSTHTHVSGI